MAALLHHHRRAAGKAATGGQPSGGQVSGQPGGGPPGGGPASGPSLQHQQHPAPAPGNGTGGSPPGGGTSGVAPGSGAGAAPPPAPPPTPVGGGLMPHQVPGQLAGGAGGAGPHQHPSGPAGPPPAHWGHPAHDPSGSLPGHGPALLGPGTPYLHAGNGTSHSDPSGFLRPGPQGGAGTGQLPSDGAGGLFAEPHYQPPGGPQAFAGPGSGESYWHGQVPHPGLQLGSYPNLFGGASPPGGEGRQFSHHCSTPAAPPSIPGSSPGARGRARWPGGLPPSASVQGSPQPSSQAGGSPRMAAPGVQGGFLHPRLSPEQQQQREGEDGGGEAAVPSDAPAEGSPNGTEPGGRTGLVAPPSSPDQQQHAAPTATDDSPGSGSNNSSGGSGSTQRDRDRLGAMGPPSTPAPSQRIPGGQGSGQPPPRPASLPALGAGPDARSGNQQMQVASAAPRGLSHGHAVREERGGRASAIDPQLRHHVAPHHVASQRISQGQRACSRYILHSAGQQGNHDLHNAGRVVHVSAVAIADPQRVRSISLLDSETGCSSGTLHCLFTPAGHRVSGLSIQYEHRHGAPEEVDEEDLFWGAEGGYGPGSPPGGGSPPPPRPRREPAPLPQVEQQASEQRGIYQHHPHGEGGGGGPGVGLAADAGDEESSCGFEEDLINRQAAGPVGHPLHHGQHPRGQYPGFAGVHPAGFLHAYQNGRRRAEESDRIPTRPREAYDIHTAKPSPATPAGGAPGVDRTPAGSAEGKASALRRDVVSSQDILVQQAVDAVQAQMENQPRRTSCDCPDSCSSTTAPGSGAGSGISSNSSSPAGPPMQLPGGNNGTLSGAPDGAGGLHDSRAPESLGEAGQLQRDQVQPRLHAGRGSDERQDQQPPSSPEVRGMRPQGDGAAAPFADTAEGEQVAAARGGLSPGSNAEDGAFRRADSESPRPCPPPTPTPGTGGDGMPRA
ncbi:unnamed protein product [Amoebophrya sp. A120]|nr:unnamed protein product [Amoebophrya sp. A120]|eukprot:GSA120T00002772001.1